MGGGVHPPPFLMTKQQDILAALLSLETELFEINLNRHIIKPPNFLRWRQELREIRMAYEELLANQPKLQLKVGQTEIIKQ